MIQNREGWFLTRETEKWGILKPRKLDREKREKMRVQKSYTQVADLARVLLNRYSKERVETFLI